MNNLKCAGTSVVFQEVPNEVSLVFSISGCPYRCPDCHSKYLWNDIGVSLENIFFTDFQKYKNYITCVCFMEGTQNLDELKQYCGYAKEKGKKVCLYTGGDLDFSIKNFALENLDYLKVGSFKKELGGLDKKTTNQKFYKIENGDFVDCTKLFQKNFS